MALINGLPNRTVYGTRFADEIHVNGKAVAYGESGDDTIYGSSLNNRLYGQDGNDTIYSGGGHDEAWGGRGDDTISTAGTFDPVKFHGDAGNDRLTGNWGNDFLDGGDGNDQLIAFGGTDYLRGGPGDDALYFLDDERFSGGGQFDGGAGFDTLHIYSGTFATPIEINITGESRGNLEYAKGFEDPSSSIRLNFTGINSIVNGESGDGDRALLFHGGGNSDMTVAGGSRDDVFIGGDGNETFTGLGGNDSFVFAFDNIAEHPGKLAMGHDRVLDFHLGEDTLAFDGGEGQMTTVQSEHDGMTTYTASDAQGHEIHVLDVVGVVGLPPIGLTDFI